MVAAVRNISIKKSEQIRGYNGDADYTSPQRAVSNVRIETTLPSQILNMGQGRDQISRLGQCKSSLLDLKPDTTSVEANEARIRKNEEAVIRALNKFDALPQQERIAINILTEPEYLRDLLRYHGGKTMHCIINEWGKNEERNFKQLSRQLRAGLIQRVLDVLPQSELSS